MYISDRVVWSIPSIRTVDGLEYLCIDYQVDNQFLDVAVSIDLNLRPLGSTSSEPYLIF